MDWLVEEDLRRFARDGYLVVPDVVPEPLLRGRRRGGRRPARRRAAGRGHRWTRTEPLVPAPSSAAELRPLSSATRRPSGSPRSSSPRTPLDHAFDHIQIATTVPPFHHVPGGPHIDGHRPGPDAPASFTLLAAVFLTDQRASQSGNLWVWPGSHLDHQRLFLDRGTDRAQGDRWSRHAPPPAVPLSAPVEVKGGRGDLLLAHFLLGHNKGGNTGPQVRRTIYYRLAVPGHADRWASTFLDPWTEYLPVRRALAA